MSADIPERDWKYLRSIRKELLDRLCHRILGEIQEKSSRGRTEQTAHDLYLAVYQLVDRSDREIGDCFDDWRRSTILTRLFSMVGRDLLNEEELGYLNEETREKLRWWKEMNKQSESGD